MKKLLFALSALIVTTSVLGLCNGPQRGTEVAKITRSELKENSGIDFSNQHSGVFWALNDSGNEPDIFAIGIDGKNYGKFRINGARLVDWEDIALARCFHRKDKDCIYIGDIGDNFRLRDDFTVYVVEEPADYKSGGTLELVKAITFKVRAKANFEAFVVNETTEELYFISKNDYLNSPRDVATIYSLKTGANFAEALSVLDFRKLNVSLKKKDKVITSADFDAGSGTLLLGTYGSAFEIKLSELGAFKEKVRKIKVPELEQAEAIAYYWKEGRPNVVTASEGKNSPLILISCQSPSKNRVQVKVRVP